VQKELAAAEECAAAIGQQLQGMQQTPRTGREASPVWELMLQLQGNRCFSLFQACDSVAAFVTKSIRQ
jgi:hypothetical protein